MRLKQKTVNYLHSSAAKADVLLAQAIKYRTAFNNAKTSVSRDYYKKKLTNTINKLQPLMSMFSDLERIKAEREGDIAEAEVATTSEEVAE